MANIQQGSSGPQVTQLQQTLANLGFNPGPIDGKFGPKTLAAVKQFQQSKGLKVDGIVGPITSGALYGNSGQQTTQPKTNQINSNNQQLAEILQNNPTFAEQYNDPKLKSYFDSLSPDLLEAYLPVINSLNGLIESGNMINPDIEISPAQAAEFLNQAKTELDPYYQEQIGFAQKDLDESFQRLQQDYENGIDRLERDYVAQTYIQDQNEADAGTTFSSGRVTRRNDLAQKTSDKLADAATELARGAQDAGTNVERVIGSNSVGTVPSRSIKTLSAAFTPDQRGFNQTGSRTLFTPSGNIMGSLQKEREVATKNRASELEGNYRRNRILNLSPLNY